MATYYDPSTADAGSKAATAGYYDALAKGATQSQALDAAKFAWQKMNDAANLSGYFPSEYGFGLGGNATMPNIQWTTPQFGQYYPGGFNSVSPGTPTQAAIQNQQQYGLNQAAATGVYYDPGNMTYKPGTFVRDPSNNAIGQIQSNGRLQIFGDQGDFLRAGGSWDMVNNPDMIRNVSSQEFNSLANDPSNPNVHGGGTATLDMQAMYGAYGVPQSGQQTLAAQKQNADLYGYSGAGPGGTGPGTGQQTMASQQQQWQQGFSEQQFNAQQQQLQQQNAQAYLTLLSNLRGPADWAKYQQVLGSTPNGMRDLYAAAAGQYVPGGGATTGMPTQAANLQTMQQQVQQGAQDAYGNTYQQYQPGSTYYNGYQYQPQQADQYWGGGQQAGGNQTFSGGANLRDSNLPNGGNTGQQPGQMYAQTQGSNQTWGSGIGVGQQQASPAQAQQAYGNGTNTGGAGQYNLPAPNQIAAQSWNNMAPSQQQMLLGMYEANGWDKNDVMALHNQSLPKYAQNSSSAGTWRLQ